MVWRGRLRDCYEMLASGCEFSLMSRTTAQSRNSGSVASSYGGGTLRLMRGQRGVKLSGVLLNMGERCAEFEEGTTCTI